MIASDSLALESINKEVKKIHHDVTKLRIEDKAGGIFFIFGLLLLCSGFIIIGAIYSFVINLYLIFISGFFAMELLVIGYSLIHKSLRGAWL